MAKWDLFKVIGMVFRCGEDEDNFKGIFDHLGEGQQFESFLTIKMPFGQNVFKMDGDKVSWILSATVYM